LQIGAVAAPCRTMSPPVSSVRVLHVHATPCALGGSERTLMLVVSVLCELGVDNYHLYGKGPPPVTTGYRGVLSEPSAFCTRPSPAAMAKSYRRIAQYVRHHHIDLIHARLWAPTLLRRALLRVAPTV